MNRCEAQCSDTGEEGNAPGMLCLGRPKSEIAVAGCRACHVTHTVTAMQKTVVCRRVRIVGSLSQNSDVS